MRKREKEGIRGREEERKRGREEERKNGNVFTTLFVHNLLHGPNKLLFVPGRFWKPSLIIAS